MFLANKASKVKVAVMRDKYDSLGIDWVSCKQVMNMCPKGSAPLLERWRILEWAAYPLEKWRPLPVL
jgi:hypothetical protein